MDTLRRYAPHLLYILPALAFAASGAAKLAGVPEVLQSFADMGLPPLFGTFIGICEIAGAIGLLIPRTRLLAAAGLIAIMLGAVYYHIAYAVPSPIPAFVLIALLAGSIWQSRRRQIS